MIDFFSPVLNDVVDIFVDYLPVTDYGYFADKLLSVTGYPYLSVVAAHSDGSTSGCIILNPLFICAVILICIGVYSVFKLIGVFLNSL